jgi:hypothetical protein
MSKTSAGVLLILAFICMFGGMMWDASVGSSWDDLNNTTTDGTIGRSATQAGVLFGYGFGMILIAIGLLLAIGAVLVIAGSFGGR